MEIINNENHTTVKTTDKYGTTISFLYYFCILAAYYVIRPLRDQLAVELGSEQLSWFFSATFATTLLLTPVFSWVVSRWPRRVIMPVVNLFFAVCQLGLMHLFYNQSLISIQNLGFLFFVWVSVFNLFVVSVFWSFMSDIWNDAQACRYYPMIALGGTLGAIVGPVMTSSLVGILGSAPLLAISAALLIVAVLCVLYLGHWAHQYGVRRDDPNNEAPLGGGMLDGLKQIFSNRFITTMAIMMLLNDAIGTIAYVLITDYSGVTLPKDVIAQTRFAANIDMVANVIQVVIQFTLTRWLLIRYGAGSVFMIWGGIMTFACFVMVVFSDPYALVLGFVPWVALIQILTRSFSYGMIQPARETLYTLVPRDLRYKGKNAVDTVLWRAGDVVSLSLINLFRDLGVHVAGFGIIWATLAGASGWIGKRLADRVENSNNQS